EVVDEVIRSMGDVYPELRERRDAIVETTRREETRVLGTIEGGMERFDELAPAGGSTGGTISGEDAFRLYDTVGFPLGLTEVMARERGYDVDEMGFEVALERQRLRSREDRSESSRSREEEALGTVGRDAWTEFASFEEQRWTGWESHTCPTDVLG